MRNRNLRSPAFPVDVPGVAPHHPDVRAELAVRQASGGQAHRSPARRLVELSFVVPKRVWELAFSKRASPYLLDKGGMLGKNPAGCMAVRIEDTDLQTQLMPDDSYWLPRVRSSASPHAAFD